jgi:hypothetical protein
VIVIYNLVCMLVKPFNTTFTSLVLFTMLLSWSRNAKHADSMLSRSTHQLGIVNDPSLMVLRCLEDGHHGTLS